MGLFDSFKNVFGGKSENADSTVAPSQMLRDAGIDPSGLKMRFASDGAVSVTGQISDESDRQKIIEVLSGAEGVTRVEDHMTVAAPVAAEPEQPSAGEADAVGGEATASETAITEEVEVPAPAPEAADGSGRTYTVQSGDTLWKISEEVYGKGSKYMTIFEANTDILEHPDRIFPGQELKIPDLED